MQATPIAGQFKRGVSANKIKGDIIFGKIRLHTFPLIKTNEGAGMAIKKKEEINFDLLIGLGNPPIRINGFDISRDKMPSEEFYSGKHGICAGKFGQRDDSPGARMDDDAAWGD